MKTRLQILILQHPQEPDRDLGSACLVKGALQTCTLKVGLSWPNLAKALGQPAENSKWAVLFLGGREGIRPRPDQRLIFLSKKEVYEPGDIPIEGVVVLDGTWAQAKTMWWRNPWLLKLKRAVLNPERKSAYGELRREPRRECLSTLESVAEVLDAMGEKATVGQALRADFAELLARYRAMISKQP